ncbi:hypothetical protein MTR_0116s0030 [Medicago truncatula]|uniref:Uncharacterized protein n=1 Tax=Medicago truncatula TaxID=3880 RepID=A0A072TSZ7_MEDTR|nr:hypothetical protein MTR_0116s0030 [Medicago truncatula]
MVLLATKEHQVASGILTNTRATRCTETPAYAWPKKGSHQLFLHKKLFPGIEPVTLQSHDNNFTSVKVTPLTKSDKCVEKFGIQLHFMSPLHKSESKRTKTESSNFWYLES